VASFDEAIPPGKAGKIQATLRTANYRGAVVKTIAVTTNDATAPSSTLTLKARVVGSVELLPNPTLSIMIAGPESRRGRLIVRKDASESGTLAVSNVKSSIDWVAATTRRVERPEPAIEGLPDVAAGDFVVELSAPGETPAGGSFSGSLTFDTGLPREPQISVPLYAYVKARITVSPREVILRPGAEQTVLVALRVDVNLEEVTATAEPPGFKTSLERTNARTLRLHVSLDDRTQPPPDSGAITLRAGSATASVDVRVQR